MFIHQITTTSSPTSPNSSKQIQFNTNPINRNNSKNRNPPPKIKAALTLIITASAMSKQSKQVEIHSVLRAFKLLECTNKTNVKRTTRHQNPRAKEEGGPGRVRGSRGSWRRRKGKGRRWPGRRRPGGRGEVVDQLLLLHFHGSVPNQSCDLFGVGSERTFVEVVGGGRRLSRRRRSRSWGVGG